MKTDLDILVSKQNTKCITCSEDEFDSYYDAFMKACEDEGIETIIHERTEYFTELYGFN